MTAEGAQILGGGLSILHQRIVDLGISATEGAAKARPTRDHLDQLRERLARTARAND